MTMSFTKSSLHEIAPYVGRISPNRANTLIKKYGKKGSRIIDPFSGSGVIPLEGAINAHKIIASDINPYAYVLTKAKLFPPSDLAQAIKIMDACNDEVLHRTKDIDLRRVPKWVRSFFHPKTLKEAIAYSAVFHEKKLFFHLACLLGILHHQRPGFLSYPSSHSTPYLRNRKFPKSKFPEMYQYREVAPRLLKKIIRTFRAVQKGNDSVKQLVYLKDIRELRIKNQSVDLCITSPPYMNNLAYGRDNRLRLWFLGMDDWDSIDNSGYKRLSDFICLMQIFFRKMQKALKEKSLCVLVFGQARGENLNPILKGIAIKEGFKLIHLEREIIPIDRRVRKGYEGTKFEWTMVFVKD